MHSAISPAKLIISGEHAVVYGCPALAMTVDRFIQVQAKPLGKPVLLIQGVTPSIAQINMLDAYNYYLALKSNSNPILSNPHDLILFSAFQALKSVQIDLNTTGLHLSLTSSIPMGYGLGSSAAAICATIYAVMDVFNIVPTPYNVFPLALEAEHLQHGRSSGLDIKTLLSGGCLIFEKNRQQHRAIPKLPLLFVNTGHPQSCTGEAVLQARKHFENKLLLDAFTKITLAIDQAITENDHTNLINAVRQNHRLLTQIEVVPRKVQHFITEIESLGGAGKICGAGSIKGDAAGICLVMCDHPIDDICSTYGYLKENVEGIAQGLRLS